MSAIDTSRAELLIRLVADDASTWDLQARMPVEVARELSAAGILCGQVPGQYGGPGLDATANGRLTADAGELCASTRSLMTSQGMAAWAISRWGAESHRAELLPSLVSGGLAAVAFSEPQAGSDLSAIRTEITAEPGGAVVTGEKVWVTGAAYADLVVVLGRHGDGTALVVVPTNAPGVHIDPCANPVGCRAAGHANIGFDHAVVDERFLLPGAGAPLGILVQSVLSAGRLSVAWGCLGMIRSCLRAAVRHAAERSQFGVRLHDHQLVARRIGEMVAAEQTVLRLCEHASRCWDGSAPGVVSAVLVAKHVAAVQATAVAASAAQVLASAGARDGHPVSRAHRDARLMEVIEGSTEICQLQLADIAVQQWS